MQSLFGQASDMMIDTGVIAQMAFSRTTSVFLFLFLSWSQISLMVPPAQSIIPRFNSAAAQGLVYRTDFENVTKVTANTLSMGISNWFEFQGDGGASVWMEGLDRKTSGITCHSGGRCIGMELTNITKSRRNEFDILGLKNLVGNELFVSVWQYLPADWRLHAPNDWYELLDPIGTNSPTYLPYVAVHVSQQDITKDVFALDLDARGTDNLLKNYAHLSNSPLPRGRWFHLQYYVYRHPTNGIVEVWVDDTLVLNASNVTTEDPSITDWFTAIAKIYYDKGDMFSPYRIWVDDLQIYRSVQPAIPGFPSEGILIGIVIGLVALAVKRRRSKLISALRSARTLLQTNVTSDLTTHNSSGTVTRFQVPSS
jgi:hypothetical protein